MYTISQSGGKIKRNHIACKLRICRWRRILPNCKLPHITYPCRLLINVCQIAVFFLQLHYLCHFSSLKQKSFSYVLNYKKKSKIKCTKYVLDNNFCLAYFTAYLAGFCTQWIFRVISLVKVRLSQNEYFYEIINFPKYQLKNLKDFCPEVHRAEPQIREQMHASWDIFMT